MPKIAKDPEAVKRLKNQVRVAQKKADGLEEECITRGKEIEKLFWIVKNCANQMQPEIWTEMMEVLEEWRERCGDSNYYHSTKKQRMKKPPGHKPEG